MKALKFISSNKHGETLVEVVIAVGIFTIVACAIMGVLVSSGNITQSNENMRVNYENVVGVMDCYIKNADASLGADISVDVEFKSSSTHKTIDCVKIFEGDLPASELVGVDGTNLVNIGIVKKK